LTAKSYIRLAESAIEPSRPGDQFERPQEVPIGSARCHREEEPRCGANRLVIFGEAFHQLIGQRDLALLPVLRRKLPLGFRLDPGELLGAYVTPTGVAHFSIAHSRHEKKFKENTIAEIACSKKPFQFLRLVYFGLSFHVAGPIALLE
jgi:hypothetical protein